MTYKTCNHLYDTGGVCNSAAVTDRDYCAFHLRYRARQLRSAQARARMERFDLRLPPIESMASVLSAINQLVEAVAADMIDLKRADFLLKSLRFAAQALKSADKWLPSVYHSDVAGPAIDLAAEYGLPDDLDPNTPPEVAFPPTDARTKDGCPVQAGVACAGVFPHGAIHSLPLSIDCPTLASVAEVGRLPEIEFRPDSPVTPDMVEVIEISRPKGPTPLLFAAINWSSTAAAAGSAPTASAMPRSPSSRTSGKPPKSSPPGKPWVAHNCLPLAIVGMRPLRILKSGAPSRLRLVGWGFPLTPPRSPQARSPRLAKPSPPERRPPPPELQSASVRLGARLRNY